jgi:hypothetical protein
MLTGEQRGIEIDVKAGVVRWENVGWLAAPIRSAYFVAM